MDIQREAWNETWETLSTSGVREDPWLESYASRLEAVRGSLILDLGCGLGNDSAWLLERGHRVVACDYSTVALESLAQAHPGLETRCLDLREALPFETGTAAVILADLCLHYFYLDQTLQIVSEIHRVLREGGLFLCRVNSFRDVNHGAGRGQEVEPGLFLHEGCYKRFFDEPGLDSVFSRGWKALGRKEEAIHRFAKEKWLWELALIREAGWVCKTQKVD